MFRKNFCPEAMKTKVRVLLIFQNKTPATTTSLDPKSNWLAEGVRPEDIWFEDPFLIGRTRAQAGGRWCTVTVLMVDILCLTSTSVAVYLLISSYSMSRPTMDQMKLLVYSIFSVIEKQNNIILLRYFLS